MAAAACFLPLTVSPTFDRELGHDIARQSVSRGVGCRGGGGLEERGEVSLAVDGRIERGLSPASARAAARTGVVSPARRGEGPEHGLASIRNIGCEGDGHGLGTLLWMTVGSDRSWNAVCGCRSCFAVCRRAGDRARRS